MSTPAGYQLMPLEPTFEICQAGGFSWESPPFPPRYRAMLAAAKQPEPPSLHIHEDDVQWVVNDLAELGVKIGQQFFFLCKGESLTYRSEHDDGTPRRWRLVGKREFGEVCHPVKFWKPNTPLPRRYTDSLAFIPGLSFGKPEDADWQDLPMAEMAAKPVSVQQAALESDARYREGYSAGWAEGQQAAPSGWNSVAEEVRNAVHALVGPGFHIRLEELDIESIIAAAAPAQPVGLSEQDKLDATRWRECMDQAHGMSDKHGEWTIVHLPRPKGNFRTSAAEFEAAIDAAILAAKEAP